MSMRSALCGTTSMLMSVLVATVSAGPVVIDPNRWGPDIRATMDPCDAEYPVFVKLDNGALGLAWTRIISPEVSAAIYLCSSSDLKTWGNILAVAPEGDDKLTGAFLLGSQHRLHVVHPRTYDGDFELCHSFSEDNGAHWSSATRLTYVDGADWNCRLQSRDANLYCLWDETDWSASYGPLLRFRSSYDNGTTWNGVVAVSDSAVGYAWAPSLLIDPAGTLHAFWHDWRDAALEVYYDYSMDGGCTWHTDTLLTTDDGIASDTINLTMGPAGDIHLFWLDRIAPDTKDTPGIYHRRSLGDISQGAKAWSEPNRLTSYEPQKAAKAGLTALESYQVHYGNPRPVFVDGVLHLVWSTYLVVEQPGGESRNSWIYWMYSSDDGDTWSVPTVVAHANSVMKGLNCTEYKGNLVMAWSDNRDGKLDIYTKVLASNSVSQIK